MLKVKDGKRRRYLAKISSQGNLTRGVGRSSRVSEDFVLPLDWTTKDGGSVSTSKVHLRYCSPAGQYFNSLAVVQDFLTCSRTTAGDTGSRTSMDSARNAHPLSTSLATRMARLSSISQQSCSSHQLLFAPLINQVILGV